MVDFRCAEYHNGKVVADGMTIKRIKDFGIRNLERQTRISHHTINLICGQKGVKSRTLRNIVQFLDVQEEKQLERRNPFHADTIKDLPDLKELREVLDPRKDCKHTALLDERIARLEKMVQ
jgi:hypothetical protein